MGRIPIVATVIAVILPTPPLRAHPGMGIVVAADGTIYFADVARETIWKVSPDGTRTALLRNHWTHDIELVSDGTLYYEREGDSNNSTAPSSLWRLKPGGAPELLVPETLDLAAFRGVPFTVNEDGVVYFSYGVRNARGEGRVLLRKRTPDGAVTTLAGGLEGPLYRDGTGDAATFRIITEMTTGPDGMIYLLDRDHVRRVSRDGEVTTIASDLIDDEPHDPPETSGPPTTINRLYGLCVAADGTIFVAYHAGRRVFRVASDGETSVVYRSPADWAPLGVAHRDGVLYVLEAGDRDSSVTGPRVQRVEADGRISTVTQVGDG